VTFNQLYTITNMPIKRFLDYLRRSGNEERYLRKLVEAFNPRAVEGLMCRSLVSVDWTGRLFDCDFNQMLELGVDPELPQSLVEFDPETFASRRIMTGTHCFGCTAGAGSSCGGSLLS
jgi:radical SAM/Cys-rich protein